MPESIDINSVNTHVDGRLQLIVGLCEKIGVKDIFNKHMEKKTGRPPEITKGIEAEIMLAGICSDSGYRGLYAMKDFYKYKDLEGIFHHPIKLSQINDDRFGDFLDDFYDSGCRNIFRKLAGRAFIEYGIAVKNINYDTTSKVMWGEYESTEADGKIGHVSIDFGHSKDKRDDKRQIKIGLGTTNGVITDGKVLSGNKDDKTYNKENIEDVDKLLTQMKVNRDSFYYIADSAMFTQKNIEKAEKHDIKFITRMPNNIKLAKELIKVPLTEDAQTLVLKNARDKEVKYKFNETKAEYKGNSCKLAVIYSYALEKNKKSTCMKKVEKEKKRINKKLKKYRSLMFKCIEDAEKEMELLKKKVVAKSKFHTITISVSEHKKRRPGRPSKNPENDIIKEYKLKITVNPDEESINDYIRRKSTFILCSNDLSITGENLLREYKTQSNVEKRFKVIKSPTFMNSIFLKTPHRVEALVYMLLIAIMMLTIAERIVQKGLKKSGDVVYGIEHRKKVRPTLSIILDIMDRIRTITYKSNGKTIRKIKDIDESCEKIIKLLRIPESCFAWNGGGL